MQPLAPPVVSPEVLAVLVCPLDHGKLTLNSSLSAPAPTLTCQMCGHVFQIQNGIPQMLPKE